MDSSVSPTTKGDPPSVFIVMPILNEVRYIASAIESILSQDYEHLEVVVYDGGSTDGTLEILKQYPVKVVQRPGMGQMAAINHAWQNTSADFVTWQAGDDVVYPGAIRCLADVLEAHSEVGLVYGNTDVIDGNGNHIGHHVPGNINFCDLVFSLAIKPQSALIRRSVFELSGMMDEKRRFAADYDLFLRIAQYFPMRYIPFTVAGYRIHAGSEDAKNYEKVGNAVIDVLDRFFERLDLSVEQRALRSHGVAGSRLVAGELSCLAGKRGQGWLLLFQALRAEPSSILLSQHGRRLIGRLLLPGRIMPYAWQRLKKWLFGAISHGRAKM